MDRRGFFSLLAKVPFVAAPIAAVLAAEAKAAPVPATIPTVPVGYVRSTSYAVTDVYPNGSHSHAISAPPSHTHSINHTHTWTASRAVNKLEIWNGERFVDFLSPEGADVINRVMSR